MGSGKTAFVQGLARGLGITEPVTSPSFALVHEYEAQPPLVHVDLYRIENARELSLLAIEEYFDPAAITVIEWSERASEILPANTIEVSIRIAQDGSRELEVASLELTNEETPDE
jgi:tRNA threonylcarbamoyladenosine biosynthesis protein TsaE